MRAQKCARAAACGPKAAACGPKNSGKGGNFAYVVDKTDVKF